MSDEHEVGHMDYQQQLDTRALELSAGTRELLNRLDSRMTRHEDDCMDERRSAAMQRAQLLATVNRIQISTLGQVVLLLLAALGAAFSKAAGWW